MVLRGCADEALPRHRGMLPPPGQGAYCVSGGLSAVTAVADRWCRQQTRGSSSRCGVEGLGFVGCLASLGMSRVLDESSETTRNDNYRQQVSRVSPDAHM